MAEPTTHQFVDIEEVKDGIIILKDKNLRSILMVSSINFDLKSLEEKQAVIAGFQRFLNSLDFTAQIVIHSRPLELSEYFGFLREKQEKQENELIKIQTSEYLDFVRELVTLSNIMSKFFYVVVSYNIAVIKKSGFMDKMLPKRKESAEEKARTTMEQAENELRLRIEQVGSLLAEMGLRSILLQDQQIVELFYGLYNPGVALKQKNLEALLATGDEAKQPE